MNNTKKKNLLFFFSDEHCATAPAAVPTLAHLAGRLGLDFETYICTRPQSWGGKVLPFNAHNHGESFYFLANFYDKILYCSLSSFRSFQFKREILAFGGDVVSCREPSELAEFYREVFSFFNVAIPDCATIIPSGPGGGDNALWLAPYCYPDILFSQTLGVSADVMSRDPHAFVSLGIKSAHRLYCQTDCGDIAVEDIDALSASDTYGSVTARIADRWISEASGVGFGNASCTFRWTGYFCREKILTIYEPVDWVDFVPVVRKYAVKTGNMVIVGSQSVVPVTDNVITEFAKHGLLLSLVGVDPRVGFTIQNKHPLPLDWLADAPAPWEAEVSDEYLLARIERRATPVCFMFYASDLGHLPVLPRVLDLMSLEGMRAGLAFPSTWYEYHPELLEQLFIPLDQGGVFPQVEPVLSSVGVAVAPEAEGYIAPEMLTSLLARARDQTAKQIGTKLVPKGYYPFQDACPYYRHGTGTPQFEAVAKAGFEYYFTYKHEGERARIVADVSGMIVLNQQMMHWIPTYNGDNESPETCIRRLDQECAARRNAWKADPGVDAIDWICISLDMPHFGLSPVYFGAAECHRNNGWNWTVGMQTLYKAMQYALDGGIDGELFLLKPHELVRYAKLLRQQRLL